MRAYDTSGRAQPEKWFRVTESRPKERPVSRFNLSGDSPFTRRFTAVELEPVVVEEGEEIHRWIEYHSFEPYHPLKPDKSLSNSLRQLQVALLPRFKALAGSLSRFVTARLLFYCLGLALAWCLLSNLLSALGEKEGYGQLITLPSGQHINVSAPSPVSGGNILSSPSITPERIEAILRSFNSPAAGTGQFMYQTGLKYGIDPAYALAFFINESSAGTKGIATVTKSIGNIRYTAGYENYQGFRKYPTWEAGIEDWFKLIKELYVSQWKLTTVEQIVPVYAPAADRNNPAAYIRNVNQLVASWRGTV